VSPQPGCGAAEEPLNRARPINGRDVAFAGGALIAGFIVFALSVAGVSILLSYQGSTEKPFVLTVFFSAILLLGQYLLIVGVVYGVLVRWRKLPWQSMGFRKISKGWIIGAVIVAVAMAFLSEAIERYLDYPLKDIAILNFAPEGFSWSGLIIMTGIAGLAAPLGEEILFRGILYTWIRGKWGVAAGAIISSLLFGVVHLHPVWIGFAAGIGIILSLSYEYSRTLWTPIVIHMTNNTLAILWLYYNLALVE